MNRQIIEEAQKKTDKFLAEHPEVPVIAVPVPERLRFPCAKCGGKRFLNANGSYCNAFEGSDQDPVIPCDACCPPGTVEETQAEGSADPGEAKAK